MVKKSVMKKSGAGRLVLTCATLVAAQLFFTSAPSQAKPAAKYAAIVVDANTGKTLFARSADAKRFPASLTKIMTLYILFDYLRDKRLGYETTFHVTPRAAAQSPSKLGLKPGISVKVVDLIRALVTKSANDAAVVIAENIGGTEENFAKLMTLKARKIGMTRTVFKNASGLPNAAQKTTARDMATLGLRIQRDHPQYYKFFGTRYFSYGGKRYKNHNKLLFGYRGTDGIKTGYTRASGFNLTTSVRRGDRHVIAVVMGGKTAKRRDAHMRTLLNRYLPRAVAMRKPVLPKQRAKRMAKAADPIADLQKKLTQKMMGQNTKLAAAQKKAAQETRPFPPPARLAPPQPSAPAVQPRGSHHVQIGAYSSRDSALARLAKVQQLAGATLRGHQPVTIAVTAAGKTIYRARFDGFDKYSAQAACKQLTQKNLDCAVMLGN